MEYSMAIDRRARLRPKPDAEDYVYGDDGGGGLLSILRVTDGMVWPYTPTINMMQSVDYSTYDPVHSNQEFLTYSRTRAPQIVCSGFFTAQTATEARYLLACMHFLKSVTKMDFGTQAEDPGTPPPILLFSAYGEFMFNDIPVILSNFTFDLPNDKDYVKVPDAADFETGTLQRSSDVVYENTEYDTWVPSEVLIAVTLTVQNSPRRLTNNFNLKDFKQGGLLRDDPGWV